MQEVLQWYSATVVNCSMQEKAASCSNAIDCCIVNPCQHCADAVVALIAVPLPIRLFESENMDSAMVTGCTQ